jgi:hypothetical protein
MTRDRRYRFQEICREKPRRAGGRKAGNEFNRRELKEHKEKNAEGKGLMSKRKKAGRGRQMFCCQGDYGEQAGLVVNGVIAMKTPNPYAKIQSAELDRLGREQVWRLAWEGTET